MKKFKNPNKRAMFDITDDLRILYHLINNDTNINNIFIDPKTFLDVIKLLKKIEWELEKIEKHFKFKEKTRADIKNVEDIINVNKEHYDRFKEIYYDVLKEYYDGRKYA